MSSQRPSKPNRLASSKTAGSLRCRAGSKTDSLRRSLALILLVQVDRVSALVAILIIAREVAVTGLRAIAASEGLIMSAEATGKYKMALQVIAIVLLLLEGTVVEAIGNLHLAGIVTLYLSLILGYVSGAQYVWSFWRQVGAKGL